MELTPEIVDLICDLEYRLGSHCVQNNTFVDDIIEYRYPVTIWVDDPDSEDLGYREKVKKNVRFTKCNPNADTIVTLQYNMGKNKLQVGRAIIDMLELLESRYGLCFNELEKQHRYPYR